MADASLKVAFTLKTAKELIADIEKEHNAITNTVLSPEMSRRVNAVGSAVTDALLTTARMSSAMIELASFEAHQECNTQKPGYGVQCSKAIQKSVEEIETATAILEKAIAPFANAAILSGTKRFTY